MLKVGDRLLCKKEKCIIHDIDQKFVIGKYYTIVGKSKFYYVRILDCFGFGGWYSIVYINKRSKYIWDYFYTLREVRKLKLKQLNKC